MKKLIFITLLSLLAVIGWGQGGNNCYILKGQFSGKTNLYNQTLFDTVCALIEIVDNAVSKTSTTRYSSDFKIISYDLYPTTSFMDDKIDFDSQTEWALNDIQTDNYSEYIAVLKSITNQRIEYHVRLKLPPAGVFSSLDPVQTEAIQNKIEGIMNASYLVFRTNWMAEIAGYAYLFSVVEDLINGTFSINEFDDSDFVEMDAPNNFVLSSDNIPIESNNVFDYCGLLVNGEKLYNSILNSIESEIQTIGRPTYIITSNLCTLNYKNNLKKANEEFSSNNSPVIIWLHYHIESNEVKTYIKAKNNVSKQIKENVWASVIDEVFNKTNQDILNAINSNELYTFEDNGIGDEDDNDFPTFDQENENFQRTVNTVNCNFNWFAFSFKGYWEALRDYSFLKCDVEPMEDPPGGVNLSAGHSFLAAGAAYGVVEGLKDIVVLVGHVHYFATSLVPGTNEYFTALNKQVTKGVICQDEIIGSNFSSKYYYNILIEVGQTGVNLATNIGPLISQIGVAIKDATIQAGTHPKYLGYYTGYIAFDVFLTTISGGTSKIPTVTEIIQKIKTTLKVTPKAITKIKSISSTAINSSIALARVINKTDLLKLLTNYKNVKNFLSPINKKILNDELYNLLTLTKSNVQRENYMKFLDDELGHATRGPEIKSLIEADPTSLRTIVMKICYDPSFCWDLAKQGAENWEKWARTKFFQHWTSKGKKFEIETCLKAFKNRNSPEYLSLKSKVAQDFNGIDLNDYDMFSQVQLKYGVFDKKGKEMYFVADQLFVKYKTINNIEVIDDIIIIENKLNFNTDLTSNQKAAKKINTYKVRNTDSKTSEFNSGRSLNNNTAPLIFNGQIKWYKVWDHDTGDIINDISKI